MAGDDGSRGRRRAKGGAVCVWRIVTGACIPAWLIAAGCMQIFKLDDAGFERTRQMKTADVGFPL